MSPVDGESPGDDASAASRPPRGRLRGIGAVGLALVVGGVLVVGAAAWWFGVRDGGGPARPVAVSSTISRGPDGTLWVASPDDRSVARTDPVSLRSELRVDVGGAPAETLVLPDGDVVVTRSDVGGLALVDQDGRVRTVDLPCASGAGMATIADESAPSVTVSGEGGGAVAGGARLLVTCPVDDRLVSVDPSTWQVQGWVAVAGAPVAVAAGADEVVVLSRSTGEIGRIDRTDVMAIDGGGRTDLRVTSAQPWTPDDRSVSLLDTVAVDTTASSGDGSRSGLVGVVVGYQSVDNDTARNPTDPADTGSYGALEDGQARIQPMVAGACASAVADFGDPDAHASGVHALALDGAHDRLWVVGEYSGTVLVLDCRDTPGKMPPVLASFDVGVGASGIVLDADGSVAWVDQAFDHAVARLELPDSLPAGPMEPAASAARPMGQVRFSDAALEGRRVFHDATDTHLTPSGVVACASCHPAGGQDSTRWRIGTLDIAPKVRRTPALWGLTEHDKPLHWDGGFHSMAALTTDTIRELLGGDALLVDTGAVSAWLRELPPPPAPIVDDTEAVRRGRSLFDSAALGCSTCHSGPAFTDGLAHQVDTVRTPAAMAAADPDAIHGAVVTPRLTRLAGSAPYFHDGSVPTLDDVLVQHLPGSPAPRLSSTDQADLIAYLRTL